jgi:hypothetical protein
VGIIMVDEATRQPKIKLYTDDEGNSKGDGRCCYLKYESVQLAEQILDGYELKGHRPLKFLGTSKRHYKRLRPSDGWMDGPSPYHFECIFPSR